MFKRTNDCFSCRMKRELPFIVLRVDSINVRHGREESRWLHHSTLINFESKDKSSISSLLSRSIRHVNWHRTSSSSEKKINIQQEEFSFIRTDWPIESIENDMVLFFSFFVNQRSFNTIGLLIEEFAQNEREKERQLVFSLDERDRNIGEKTDWRKMPLSRREKREEKEKRNLIGFLSPALLKSDLPTIMISEIRKRKFHWMIRTKPYPYWHLAQHRTMISSPDFLPRMTTPLPGWIYEQKVSNQSDKRVVWWKFRCFLSHRWCVGPFNRWQLIEIFV